MLVCPQDVHRLLIEPVIGMPDSALQVARGLVAAGMPVFLARPDATSRTGFSLPHGWEQVRPDPGVVDAWRPGWALCAVTGHVFDLVDIDPRSGGDERSVPMPQVYLSAETPSGGRHYFVAPLGVPSRDGVYPGVDLKSGTPDGRGRGFAFIAPTERVSKVDGLLRSYRWGGLSARDGVLRPLPDDHTGAALRTRVGELRTHGPADAAPRTIPRSVARREFDNAVQRLTERVRHWATYGWGGEAHAELLAASTHLARLAPEHAEAAFLAAFRAAGVDPDWSDLAKLHSAIDSAVPDVVVPDEQYSAVDLFFAGGDATPEPPGPVRAVDAIPAQPSDPGAFAFVGAERARRRTPPEPAVFAAFGGGVPLVYADGVHWLQGESESGKSWVADAVALDVLRSGASVILVDYEDHEAAVLERFAELGATDDDFERLVYVSGLDVAHADIVSHLRGSIGTRDYGLLVVDGVTAALSSAGLSGRDEQELTAWSDRMLRTTRAALCVDHVVKAVDDRAGMAIGSQAKKSVVTGTSFEVVCIEKFARGLNGVIELRIQKDKKGGVRSALKGRSRVRLRFVSDFDTGRVQLAVPEAVGEAVDPSQALAELQARGAAVMALVAALEDYPAANPGHSARHLLSLLRDEMNRQGRTDDMRDAVRMFKARAGVGGVIVPEWLREYEADVRALVAPVTIESRQVGAA